jgi:Rod binding domain-containing protein
MDGLKSIDGLMMPEPAAPSADVRGRQGDRRLAETAQQFESVLLHRLMEEMRRTIPESGLLEGGLSDQVQGLFWFYLAQDAAEKGGLGIGREMARQLAGRTPRADAAEGAPTDAVE